MIKCHEKEKADVNDKTDETNLNMQSLGSCGQGRQHALLKRNEALLLVEAKSPWLHFNELNGT